MSALSLGEFESFAIDEKRVQHVLYRDLLREQLILLYECHDYTKARRAFQPLQAPHLRYFYLGAYIYYIKYT
jgi:hypothetical protein